MKNNQHDLQFRLQILSLCQEPHKKHKDYKINSSFDSSLSSSFRSSYNAMEQSDLQIEQNSDSIAHIQHLFHKKYLS